ncbi:site-specific integrase [Lysobacter sp. FW306-1B-D06B]|uniref:site-specific integrase n=1 Tax=Lysobacter sp. FW306-1B-D06B TaxID=3140250 RepID=UPI00313FEB57
MRIALTKRIVATSQPRERPYELRDTQARGLLLRVQPSGHKAWIVTWAHGKRRTLGSATLLTLDQARAYASQAMAEVIQQGLPSIARPERPRCTLAAFLDDHYAPWAKIELRGGQHYVERIQTHFPSLLNRQLSEIDEAAIDRWWRNRVAGERPVAKATAARDLACLRSAISKAVEWKLLERNPLLGLRQKSVEPRKIVRFLSPDEETRLRTALTTRDQQHATARVSGNRWRADRNIALKPEIPAGSYGDHLTPVVLLAMNTGLRRGELLSLTWADVDLDARMLTVRAENAKSGRQRHVPLNAEAHAVLAQWASQTHATGRVFDVASVKKAWTGILTSARIDGFRFHDLRHHFASKLVRAGVDLNTVRELLGHADIAMTLRYAHLCPGTLAAAVAKLAA